MRTFGLLTTLLLLGPGCTGLSDLGAFPCARDNTCPSGYTCVQGSCKSGAIQTSNTGTGGAPSTGTTKPSDRFFECVVAGTGVSGQARVVVYDPALSERSTSVPSGNAVKASAWVTESGSTTRVSLAGTWSSNGTLSASSTDGWTLTGTMKNEQLAGSIASSNGTKASVMGEDITAGRASAFCGNFQGRDSGSWNFVVSDVGAVSGAFSFGTISGRASGSNLTLSWSGRTWGTNYSGGASGAVSSAGTVSGSWNGSSDGGSAVSGSWSGAYCSAMTGAPVLAAPASPCNCFQSGCCPVRGSTGQQCCVQ